MSGPQGTYVVRAERYRVPSMVHTAWSLTYLLRRLARLTDGENRWWVIEVRAYADDPFGAPIVTEVVNDSAGVPNAITRAEEAVRLGNLGSERSP